MDIKQLKRYSELAFDFSMQKRNALEKMHGRQVMAYNGCLFRADTNIINTVSTMKEHKKTFVVLDMNDNPCRIDHPDDFLAKLIERNQESLNDLEALNKQFQEKKF